MATIYYYIDESFREDAGYWHCNIGGALLDSERAVDVEVALETAIYRLLIAEGFPYEQGEFKYSDFYRGTPDAFKLKIARELTAVLADTDVRFLVSHARVRTSYAQLLQPLGGPSIVIQTLAFSNVNGYLAEPASTHVVQMIVDLGISESFRPIYDMYSATLRSIPMLKARGIPDEVITVANYRRLPRPVFLASQDSRLLQYSDLLIGLLLCAEVGRLTPFKKAMLDQLEPIMKNVTLAKVEWQRSESIPVQGTTPSAQ